MAAVEAVSDEVADIVLTPRAAEQESIGNAVDTESRYVLNRDDVDI